MADTRSTDVRVLDLRGLSPVCDYMVLATGTSPRQMRTVADDVRELAEERGHRVLGGSTGTGENWTAIDLVDVVVHLFSAEARSYYDLENLWGDAVQVEWKRDA